jgi:hypothetical protein
VYIFKGRASWPTALSSAQADYILDVDSSADVGFASSQFGFAVAPLGDFDGDGAPDFAVSAYVYTSGRGYVAIIKGANTPGGFTSLTLPGAVGTKAYALIGNTTSAINWFGWSVTSLGPFYTGGIPALIVGAPGPNAGIVYAYKGGAGLPPTLQVSNAFESYTGSGAQRTGLVLANLVPGVGIASPGTTTTVGGNARLFRTPSAVFGGSPRTLTNSAATAAGDQFSNALFGGGFSGSTVPVSFIGGSNPDVVVSSLKLGGAVPTKVYIIEGDRLTSDLDVATQADVTYTLPAGWLGAAWRSAPVRDSNGDGYAEIAIGEMQNNVGYPGQLLVLW